MKGRPIRIGKLKSINTKKEEKTENPERAAMDFGIESEPSLENPESARNSIIIGAAIIMVIVTLGYLHDAISLETEHRAEVEFSNYLSKTVFTWKNLEDAAHHLEMESGVDRHMEGSGEAHHADEAEVIIADQDYLSRLIAQVEEREYVKDLFGSLPGIIHVRVGNDTDVRSQKLKEATLTSLLAQFDSSSDWEPVTVGQNALPDGLLVKQTLFEADGHPYLAIEIPFTDQHGSLTFIKCADTISIWSLKALKNVALQAIVMFWLGMWGALILALYVSRRLQRSNAAITESFNALSTAKVDAETANITKTEFLANMSHELRTPLNAILGFSEVMKDEIFGPINNKSYRNYVDDIHLSGTHLLNLINEILEVSKIESGAARLDEVEIDVGEALDVCRVMLVSRAQKQGVEVTYTIADDLPLLFADPTYFKQIALNLISNAIKFNNAKGKVFVEVALDDRGCMKLTVSDNGIGIKKSDMSRVKERFGRAASSSDDSIGGVGLGLTIVRLLSDIHQASFTLESKYGEGTVATVLFPADRLRQPPVIDYAESRMTA